MNRRKRGHGQGRTRDRGKSWNHEYRDQSKTLSKADYPTKRDAEAAFTVWRQELDAKAKANPVTTVGELLETLIAHKHRDGRAGAYITEKMVRKHLIPAFGAFDAKTIEKADVQKYIDRRKLEKTSRGTYTRNATVNNEVVHLNQALGLLAEPRHLKIAKLPTKDGIRRGIVSEEYYRRLLNALEDWQRPVWCIGYYSGVRQGQLLKLWRKWGEEALTTGVIEVPGFDDDGNRITKNGEPHHIPLYMPAMREFLKWAIEIGNPECQYLFQRDGGRISKDTFYGHFKRIRRDAGLKHVLFHDLRRTAVTNMIEAGIPPEEAMSVSGHLTLSMLKRYSIVSSMKAKANVIRAGERMAEWFREKADSDRIRTEGPEAKPGDGAKPN